MDADKAAPQTDALILLLRSALTANGAPAFGHVVLYTSFGVVRGRTGFAFAQGLASRENGGSSEEVGLTEVIELSDVTVEHYSNHLAAASFERLYVRLSGVYGFALVSSQGSG